MSVDVVVEERVGDVDGWPPHHEHDVGWDLQEVHIPAADGFRASFLF